MILVLNSGSSSIKYRLYESGTWAVLAQGLVERIGEMAGAEHSVPDHRAAMDGIVRSLRQQGLLGQDRPLTAIGHRVVHGGETFHTAVRVNEAVLTAIRAAIPLAPLHNPPNLLGIEVCRDLWPDVPQVAVFDTAFHQTIPPRAFRYALPESCYRDLKIRRYGFHGSSFAYVTRHIALHLGNGASMAAIAGGQSVDTSMGMTPLAGLMMGTRSGDLDPGVVLYLLAQGKTPSELDRLLNRDSGLKGIARSNDMRDVLARAAEGHEDARLALDMYGYRIRQYIGAYLAVLGRVDALIFTGGIGEHAAPIRQKILENMDHLGICLNTQANQSAKPGITDIQTANSPIKILIIPTDEELEIAEQTGKLVG